VERLRRNFKQQNEDAQKYLNETTALRSAIGLSEAAKKEAVDARVSAEGQLEIIQKV
jgi:hypothetical protein